MTAATGPRVEPIGPIGAAPGRPATVLLRVTPEGPQAQTLLVSVLGLDGSWLPTPLRVGPTEPDSTVEVAVDLHPPAGTPAGRYAFVVAVQAFDAATGSPQGAIAQVEGHVVVGDPSRLAVDITPNDPRAVRTRRVAVHLGNRGTEPLRVRLDTTPSAGLRFSLRRPEVELPAGGTARVRGRLTVERRRWLGPNRRMPFVLTVQGHTTPVRADGVFVARPLLNQAVTRTIALVAIVAVWVTTGLFAVNAISRHAQKKTALTVAAPANPGGGTNSSGGGGAGGAAPGSSSGSGGGKAVTASAGSSPSRLNGTVTGASPAGARVTLTPTSLFEQQAQGVPVVNTAWSPGAVGKLSSAILTLGPALARPAARSTATATDGAFAFAGVKAPGYYLLTVTKRGFQAQKFIISATLGNPLPALKIPLVAGRGTLSGHVLDPHGHPLAGGAHVTITGGTLQLATNTATRGDVGSWSVDGVSTPGTYVVSASADGYDAASAVVTLTAHGSARQDLTLHPGVETVQGTVSFGAGQPLGGATVTVTDGTTTRKATSVTEGTPGFYSLPDLPLGTYTVTVGAGGFATQTFRAVLDGKRSAYTLPVTMTSATAAITGAVVDAGSGAALDSAGLILSGDAGTYKVVSLAGTGGFSFDGVAPGDYVLTAQAFGYQADFKSVTVHAGDAVTLPALQLTQDGSGGVSATSTITGRIVDAHTGAALTCPPDYPTKQCFVRVDIQAPDGEVTAEQVTTGLDQPYTIPAKDDPHYPKGLPPGLYKLTFSFPGYEANTLAVAVPESTPVSAVPVALTPHGTILGHLTTTTGDVTGCVIAIPVDPKSPSPPAGVSGGVTCGATATAPTDPTSDTLVPCSVNPGACLGTIDSNGDYEIRFIPHGSYWVFIRPELAGGSHALDPRFVTLSPVELTVEAGQSRRYDAALNQFATVDILVQEPNSVGDAATAGAGISVTLTNTRTGVSLAPQSTQGDGIAEFPQVPAGTYTATATDSPAGSVLSGTSAPFQVGVNEKITAPLVLSRGTGTIVGRVYSLVDDVKHVVPGAVVHVTGVTGYSGSVPVRTTFTLTTDSNGCFSVGPSLPAPAPAGCDSLGAPAYTAGTFVVMPDKVTVDASGDNGYDRYGVQTISGLGFSTTGAATGIVLTPPPTPISGGVVLHPAVNGATTADVSLLAAQLAPGAGNVTLSSTPTTSASSDATGTLDWRDSTIAAGTGGAGQALPGTYEIRATLNGYDTPAAASFTVPLETSSTAAPAYVVPTLTLNAHGSLTFAAVDAAAGTAVDGATYTLQSASSSPTITATTVTAAPDSGSVTFPDLSAAAGPYLVKIRAAGYPVVTSSAVDIDPGATKTVQVPMGQWGTINGTISGTLGDDPTHTFPLAGATVTATGTTSGTTFSTGTDSRGAYSLTGTADKPGLDLTETWTVSVSAFGYGDSTTAPLTLTGGANTTNLTLTATPISTVTISVQQDGSTTGVGSAHLTLQNPLIGSPSTCTTGADGSCTFHDLPPVVYSLTVSATGFAPLSTSVALAVGVSSQQFFVAVATRANSISGSISGRRLDGTIQTTWAAGDNLAVTLTPTGGTATATTPDPDGSYSFSNLTDGTYRLAVSANGYSSYAQNVSVTGGQAAFVNVVLQAASVQLTVTVSSSLAGVSMSGSTVTVQIPGAGGAGPTVVQSAVAVATGGSGAATAVFSQLAPASYDVVVAGPDGQLGTTVSDDLTGKSGAQTLAVTVHEALLQITVASLHDASTADPTATVTVAPAGGSAVFSQSVTANGGTVSTYVPATSASTSYTVAATVTSASDPWVAATVSSTVALTDTDKSAVSLEFVQKPVLTVYVVDSSGAPVVASSGQTLALDVPAGASSTDNKDGSFTVTGLDTGQKYTFKATYTIPGSGGAAATVETGQAHNVTVSPGANSLTITVK